MKKLFTLFSLALSCIGFAQIPTSGLIDAWELNGDITNSVAGRQALTFQQIYVCNQADLQTPIYAGIYGTNFYRTGPANTNSVGYYTHAPNFNQQFLCYSIMNPNGYNQNFTGVYENYLFTAGDNSFGTGSRSIAIWAKRYNGSDPNDFDVPFFTGQTSGNQGFILQLYLDTAYLATYGNLARAPIAIDTLWHHYVGTYDSDSLHLYYDGVKVATQYAPGVNTAAAPLYFGLQSNMVIDQPMVYNRKLTNTEVQNIYNNCQPVNAVVSPSGGGITVDITASSYQWINCATNQPINNATNQNFIPTANGEYAVNLAINGCAYTSDCFTVANVDINENTLQNMNVFPNPASSEFTISNVEPGTRISIIDITGKVIQTNMLYSTTQVISTHDLVNGIYFIKLELKGITQQTKLIIRK